MILSDKPALQEPPELLIAHRNRHVGLAVHHDHPPLAFQEVGYTSTTSIRR